MNGRDAPDMMHVSEALTSTKREITFDVGWCIAQSRLRTVPVGSKDASSTYIVIMTACESVRCAHVWEPMAHIDYMSTQCDACAPMSTDTGRLISRRWSPIPVRSRACSQ